MFQSKQVQGYCRDIKMIASQNMEWLSVEDANAGQPEEGPPNAMISAYGGLCRAADYR